MEFKFNPNLEYQLEAIKSIVNLFEGQDNIRDNRLLIPENGVVPNGISIGNKDILSNLKDMQERNSILEKSEELENMDFSVEMETGTGKTYVYLRIMLELYKKYGWKKFIVVVPSVAIREGVLKNLEITKDHFKKLYDNISYNFFEYDSKKLQKVRSFSRNNEIEIMVITLQSFNKGEDNVMFQYRDELNGKRPIDLIKETNPILVLDEPQNMESENSKEAISELNPLFTLRYSATHRRLYNLVYQLTPYDAYKEGLVKQIDVLSVVKEHDFNTTLIEVEDIKRSSELKAKLKIHKDLKRGIKEGTKTVKTGDDLYRESKGVENYEGMKVSKINAKEGFVEFNDGTKVHEGESTDTDIEKIQRLQIRETIKEHFEKAIEYQGEGIKVLSLFFIDRVSHYTDENGHIRMAFEEEFNRLKNKEKYEEIYGDTKPKDVMGSYFSEYKSKNHIKNDTEAYELIMKDKEKLLSLDESTEFIFSHSALKEGWDSPNVFNICTLNNTVSRIKKRQEIGRGVRLPVNQEGERIFDDNINILTVIANESYADYVEKLQTEYEEVTGYSDDMRDRVNDRDKRKVLTPLENKLSKSEFEDLWSKISEKTKYKSEINTEKLVEEASESLSDIYVKEPEIGVKKARIETEEEELKSRLEFEEIEELDNEYRVPNVIKRISEETNLTKSTVYRILDESKTLDQLIKNPREYLTKAINKIKRIKENLVVNEIEYIKTNDSYSKEIFRRIKTYEDKTVEVDKSVYNEIKYDSDGEEGFAKRLDSDEQVIFFIKLPPDFKIPTPIGNYNPDWAILFQEKTREGPSSPKLYFVRETKFVKDPERGLREKEKLKIKCADKHFFQLKDIDFDVITDLKEDIVNPENSVLK